MSLKTISLNILLASIAGAGMGSPLLADTFFSAEAAGGAKQFEILCDTCSNPVTTLSRQTDGGFGNLSAHVEFANGTLASYEAISVLTGQRSLPHLGAIVTAGIVAALPTFFYEADAEARATQ